MEQLKQKALDDALSHVNKAYYAFVDNDRETALFNLLFVMQSLVIAGAMSPVLEPPQK